jgi:hypothetical protein
VYFLRRSGGLAVGVVGVGSETEADYTFVRLLGMGVELGQAREVAEDDGQDSGGRRVEGSEMTDRALSENSAHAIDYIVRRQARRLIYDYDTVHRDLQPGNL